MNVLSPSAEGKEKGGKRGDDLFLWDGEGKRGEKKGPHPSWRHPTFSEGKRDRFDTQ